MCEKKVGRTHQTLLDSLKVEVVLWWTDGEDSIRVPQNLFGEANRDAVCREKTGVIENESVLRRKNNRLLRPSAEGRIGRPGASLRCQDVFKRSAFSQKWMIRFLPFWFHVTCFVCTLKITGLTAARMGMYRRILSPERLVEYCFSDSIQAGKEPG